MMEVKANIVGREINSKKNVLVTVSNIDFLKLLSKLQCASQKSYIGKLLFAHSPRLSKKF